MTFTCLNNKIRIGLLIFVIILYNFKGVIGALDNKFVKEQINFESEELEDKYGNDGYQANEQECPPGKWWHIRGQRCVPVKCPMGNKFRDVNSGECIRKSNRRFNSAPVYYFARSTLRFKTPLGYRFYRGRIRG